MSNSNEPDLRFTMKHPAVVTHVIVELRGNRWVASTPGGGYLTSGSTNRKTEAFLKDEVYYAIQRHLS